MVSCPFLFKVYNRGFLLGSSTLDQIMLIVNNHFKQSFILFCLGECITLPSLCRDGLSLGLRIRLDEKFSREKKFIFDSGGHQGNGVTMYVEDGNVFAEVGSQNNIWRVNEFIFIYKEPFLSYKGLVCFFL